MFLAVDVISSTSPVQVHSSKSPQSAVDSSSWYYMYGQIVSEENTDCKIYTTWQFLLNTFLLK